MLTITGGLLIGCGEHEGSSVSSTDGVPRVDAYCSLDGMSPAIRQTVVIIDEQAVQRAASAELIRVTNPELFQLVTGLSALDGVERGVMGPRERLALYVAPADGGAPKLAFSGCAPGFSKAELKKMAGSASPVSHALGAFVGSSPTQKVAHDAEIFQTAILGALVRITGEVPSPRAPVNLLDRSLVRSLQSAPQLAAPENGVPRLFFYTDLKSLAPEGLASVEVARGRGFEDADKAHLPLGRAEVHIVGPRPAVSAEARAYAQAFFLESEGLLLSWGGATFSALPAAPVRLEAFSGEINYPPNAFPAQVRLSTDRNGTLVDSWFIVKKERSISTPLTGTMTCTVEEDCRITTDQGGFAQVWSTRQGTDPDFTSLGLPMGGLRQLVGDIHDDTFSGKVFDPMVGQIGPTPGVKSLDFKMTRSRP